MYKGIVVKNLITKYVIIDLSKKTTIIAQPKGKIKDFNQKKITTKSIYHCPIKIGDIVEYEFKYNNFLIINIQNRKNELERPNIANIDQVLLIFSLTKPKIDFKLLDKFLIILQRLNIKIILILTKRDLINQEQFEYIQNQISYYEKWYSVIYMNAKQKKDINYIIAKLKNKITILAGQTGVGKSTLFNNLTSLRVKTQPISLTSLRGKHTTTGAQLYMCHQGYLADTPGFSKLKLSNLKTNEIKNFYPDFNSISEQCFFGNNCLHIEEKKCKIIENYQKGLITESRYFNYVFLVKQNKKNKN
ncbi:MAG: ribosome small subunit-dependent GTPase A [Pigeon pea little leaf phytoplasma]|uniref:Small ribosomal subunit biogenesis GTPase RsgA n=1 Tax=Candidatus Phytoplasma fabacearum TaxID=2982628 RepID=A0ABU8ZT98_9MOLU|nr:ribosome small subunit-dependent GTPase A ['Bituminaria bituminosa' little leaf phytoplasma]MDV3148612.1 ribosome small subunit-dependent GTPase A [Pigeon pea little leaf phytoplasma]MDO7983614.1 ribosome small subunit-dependent GTPase A ['Bituminaria bituminosa' little leaf phytoplasma]MDO8023943.1 ribosome small subunit-dependent GTPase A ['Bituminaria bituminosa' little leaf phytoplasma]MDO8030525.1 ribosome small subunit-dependent GTPase A ['Bituminaria bituminosa' little leaf phytoplasm